MADPLTTTCQNLPRGFGSKYTPLEQGTKQIRLLHVLPGRLEDLVSCSLQICDLADEPQYETISYVWGNENDRSDISLDSHDTSVPASAARAIRRVRFQDRIRVIWIDAVCIDQSNADERGHQVAMMGQIYTNGLRNLIYLGEDNHGAAISSIGAILDDAYDQHEHFIRETFEISGGHAIFPLATTNRIRIQYDSAALTHFYTNDWFRYIHQPYRSAHLDCPMIC